MIKRIERKIASSFDWPLFLCMSALCFIGLGVLASAGYDAELEVSRAVQRQAVSMLIGMAFFFFAMLISTNIWRRWSPVVYLICLGFLVAILFVGSSAGGATRWLNLGGFRFQPSEIMKVGLILAVAYFFAQDKRFSEGYTIPRLFLPVCILAVPVGFTLVQPDLGTAICLLLIGGTMILLAGVRPGTLVRLGLLVPFAAGVTWMFMHDYQKKRILTFLWPETDPLGSGYHAIQSMIAVGSGQVAGKGFLKGTQTQLRFLPEQTTDFLFSVLAEEWGFFGSVAVIAVYSCLIYRLVQIASRCQDRYAAFVCCGVAGLVFWQTFINIGMVTGTLPVVGITLPLLSYGGSSVLTIMTAIGLAAGVSSRRFSFS